jgi:hypothetical protein
MASILTELDFRVDTQADLMVIPVHTARDERIPFSQQNPKTAIGLVGETITYRGQVHVVIAGQAHDWPCDFVEVPVRSEGSRLHPKLLPVLGRAGFLDEYAIAVDSGYLIITRLGPVRRWLRRRLEALWGLLGMVHPTTKPL